MDDKTNRLRMEAQRGANARLVLDNPVFKDAMKAMQDQIVQQWGECPVRDVEGQKLLLQLHKLSRKFETTLTGLVETGKLAQFDLDSLRDESATQKLFRRIV